MTVIDASVEFWRRGVGDLPYSAEQLEDTIHFFEGLTGIQSNSMSYFGSLPDEELAAASLKWKAWYREHASELKYDAMKRRVIRVGH